jgi:hypothetical protein
MIGFVMGFLLLIIYAHHVVKNIDKNDRDDFIVETEKVKKDIDKILSIRERFARASKITDEQMSLLSGVERPSASALHSKHQNSIISELKKLEEQKMDIFRSILKDGVDPNLSIMVDGKPTTMKMSEAVSLYESHNKPYDKTDTKNTRSNLRLITNEANDGSSQEENPS